MKKVYFASYQVVIGEGSPEVQPREFIENGEFTVEGELTTLTGIRQRIENFVRETNGWEGPNDTVTVLFFQYLRDGEAHDDIKN